MAEVDWRTHYRYAVASMFAFGEVVSKLRQHSTLSDLEIDALIGAASEKWIAQAERQIAAEKA